MKIFLATGNKNKIKEIEKIFKMDNIEILSINDGIEIPEVVEDGDTFEANSQKKAVEIAKFTNMITVADDSGLCVDALNGAPGVYSARYAGEHGNDLDNNMKVVKELQGIENRKARFVCVISIAKQNQMERFTLSEERLRENLSILLWEQRDLDMIPISL